jgi:hypothetical protein
MLTILSKELLMLVKLNDRTVKSLEVDGLDGDDYPDFCDAYFSYAEFEDGTPLTDEQLEELADENPEILNLIANQDYVDGSSDYDFDQDR